VISNHNTPFVSVVMAVHNGADYLQEAVNSILNQTHRNFEFIIIDDGSTDETADILRKFLKIDQRISIITQNNYGLAKSLNIGIKQAKSRYIARMDADDISLPDRFKLQLAYLETHPEISVLGGQVCFFGKHRSNFPHSQLPQEPQLISQGLKKYCQLIHPTTMFRKEAIISCGSYRPCFSTAQDYDLWLRVDERSKLANLPDVILNYRTHTNQLSVHKLSQQAFCWLAAKESAKYRRQGCNDPLDGQDSINLHTLELLGLNNNVVYKRFLQFAVRAALNAIARGGKEQAIYIMDELAKHDSAKAYPRLILAHQAWVRGCLCRYNGQKITALGAIAKAILLRPAYIQWVIRSISNKLQSG